MSSYKCFAVKLCLRRLKRSEYWLFDTKLYELILIVQVLSYVYNRLMAFAYNQNDHDYSICAWGILAFHGDVMTWKWFPHYLPPEGGLPAQRAKSLWYSFGTIPNKLLNEQSSCRILGLHGGHVSSFLLVDTRPSDDPASDGCSQLFTSR